MFTYGSRNEKKIERSVQFGKEYFAPEEFIIVRYREGALLINREILKYYPDSPYKVWLDKDPPALPETTDYPLRYKFKVYSDKS